MRHIKEYFYYQCFVVTEIQVQVMAIEINILLHPTTETQVAVMVVGADVDKVEI